MSKSTSNHETSALSEAKSDEHKDVSEHVTTHKPLLWSAMTGIVVVVVIYLVALYVGGAILSIYAGMHRWSASYANQWLTGSVVAQFLYVLIDEALTVLLLWAFIRWRHYKGVLKALGLLKPHLKDFRHVAGGIVVYFAVYVFTINIAAHLTQINLNQEQDVGFQIVTTHRDLILTFFSLVLLPPIVEEIIFRGFLFSGLRRRFKFVGAALVTSLIFCAPHFLEGSGGGLLWSAGIDTFVLSLVLCYVREKSGRLWAGMTIHGFKNLVAFYVLFLHH